LFTPDEPFGPFKKEISTALVIEVSPFQGREANHRGNHQRERRKEREVGREGERAREEK
jgi:hypothetical protein